MVDRVDRALRAQLGLPLGLADPKVHVLDPCTGTGSYLTAVLDRMVTTLKAQGGDGLVAAETKQAALSRIHGFELLPAPFVIAHLRIGIALQRLGVPLNAGTGERANVYLTNALTGWVDGSEHPMLPFPEFIAERDAAESSATSRSSSCSETLLTTASRAYPDAKKVASLSHTKPGWPRTGT